MVRSLLPTWRRALADKSGATFAEVVAPQDRSYLEWEQEGLAQRIAGVTVLTFDESGLIINVAGRLT
jgi:hypothetical protein